jgi:deoxyhypusine synthase
MSDELEWAVDPSPPTSPATVVEEAGGSSSSTSVLKQTLQAEITSNPFDLDGDNKSTKRSQDEHGIQTTSIKKNNKTTFINLETINDSTPIPTNNIIIPSNDIPNTATIQGFQFQHGQPVHWLSLIESYRTTGFQASNLHAAIQKIREMRSWRLSDEPIDPDDDLITFEQRNKIKCKIFLGYTSNLVSSGLRETFNYLARNKLVDVIVSSAGGIEEDFIKCMGNMYMGEFNLKGSSLRQRGLNRIGNILAPNENYCKFETWIEPILDQMLQEQNELGIRWTPSKFIHRLGKEINNENSIYYWCYRNNIPVFCPSLTDGTIGDFLYFHSYKNPGLILDIIGDIRAINDEAVHERRTGVIILGGGLVKHHIYNANLMRNGTDYAVVISTAHEFDGSDSGASPDEAVSWGKIRPMAKPVKVFAEATIVFPIIVASTFAQ